MEGLPSGVRPADDDLQPLRALGGAWRVGAAVSRAGSARPIKRGADDRLDARQGAPLGGRRKRGAQRQAIGRSRGGRNTKIHALADAKGRFLSILLSGGEAHDYPLGQRLARRTKGAAKLLGDKAYDGDDFRQELKDRSIEPVIPGKCNRKRRLRFDKQTYKLRHRIENAICRLKDFRRIATRYDKLARNFLASICLAAAIVWWIL